MRQRDALDQHRVGRIRPGAPGAADQIMQQIDIVGGVCVEFLISHLLFRKRSQ